MNSIVKYIAVASLTTVALGSRLWAGDFQIHDGDRVVFLGDSITEQKLYTTYIEAYATTRHPDWKLSFRNVGWGGDTAWLRQRTHADEKTLFAAGPEEQAKIVTDAVGRGLARDVVPLRPTFVTVKFGMNDHSYQPFREDIFNAYVRSQTEIAKDLKAAGARVAFLTPQPIEEKRADPDKDVKNMSLRKFSDGLKVVAGKTETSFVDQFDPYLAIMMRERMENPNVTIGGGDAVHPGPIGHTVMAWAVLKGLGASALVSRAEIDFTSQKVRSVTGAKVSNLKVEGSTVSFDRLDDALPMPIDPKAIPALKLAPILQELDQYELRVTGLPQGDYEILIDGQAVRQAGSQDLLKSVNLATTAGPITKQAGEVLELIFTKNNQFFNRWRNIQLASLPGWAQGPELEVKRAAEVARQDKVIAETEAQIEVARKPKSHHFEIKPAPAK